MVAPKARLALLRESFMPGPIDDALKHVTELSPQDWVVRRWAADAAALIDADIKPARSCCCKAVTGSASRLRRS